MGLRKQKLKIKQTCIRLNKTALITESANFLPRPC